MSLPGLRNIKTAISVVVCALTITIFNNLFGTHITYFYACITAVFILQQTIQDSMAKAKGRILGTILGSLVAIFIGYFRFVLFDGKFDLIFLFIAIVVIIYILDVLSIQYAVMIGCIMVLGSFGDNQNTFILYSILRGAETIYGAWIGLMINKFVYPYRKE